MSEKTHQSSSSEYQIRVDGKPISYHYMLCNEALGEWVEVCKANPDCYVDIVRVDTQILISQFEYHQMKKHFCGQAATEVKE